MRSLFYQVRTEREFTYFQSVTYAFDHLELIRNARRHPSSREQQYNSQSSSSYGKTLPPGPLTKQGFKDGAGPYSYSYATSGFVPASSLLSNPVVPAHEANRGDLTNRLFIWNCTKIPSVRYFRLTNDTLHLRLDTRLIGVSTSILILLPLECLQPKWVSLRCNPRRSMK